MHRALPICSDVGRLIAQKGRFILGSEDFAVVAISVDDLLSLSRLLDP